MEQNRLFSKNHLWVCRTDRGVTLGLSKYAVAKLGGIVFLNLPDIGEILELGGKIGDIESIKTVSDLISPVHGVVLEVNDKLLEAPEEIGKDPYRNWLILIKADAWPEDLMDEEAYQYYTEHL